MEVCRFEQVHQARKSGFPIQDTRDVVRRERCGFNSARARQICKEHIHEATTDFSKCASVEEQERGTPMAKEKKVQCLREGQLLLPRFFPEAANGFVSFLIMAVLSAASLARCLVEAVDKLPTPVLDERGSGL